MSLIHCYMVVRAQGKREMCGAHICVVRMRMPAFMARWLTPGCLPMYLVAPALYQFDWFHVLFIFWPICTSVEEGNWMICLLGRRTWHMSGVRWFISFANVPGAVTRLGNVACVSVIFEIIAARWSCLSCTNVPGRKSTDFWIGVWGRIPYTAGTSIVWPL